MPYAYDYPRPMVTADIIAFSIRRKKLQVLLVQRGHNPFKGYWALPGGYIEMDEKLEESALRELREETGLKPTLLEQFRVYGDPGRDPRGRTVTVVFFAAISASARPRASSDAAEVGWHDFASPPSMAFDHGAILRDALVEFRRRIAEDGRWPAAVRRARVSTINSPKTS